MPFDFPASPANGQQFTPPSGSPTYTFNGTAWTMGEGVHKIFVGDVPPVNPVPGQLWWESDSGDLYVYYYDGNSSQWVQINVGMALLAGYLPLTGGTLTGALSLPGDPASALQAAPKQYVDGFLPKTGGTLSGDLSIIKPAGSRAVLNLENSDTAQRSQINLRRSGNPLFEMMTSASAAADTYFYTVDNALVERPVMTFERSTGRTILQSGQMTFPVTANPSTDPYTQDDYREGVFAPSLKFGGNSVGMTYSAQQGRYQRVGNTAKYWGHITLTAKGTSTGVATIVGLPFNAGNAVSYYAGYISYLGAMTGITVTPWMMLLNSTTSLNMWITGGALTEANFSNTTDFYFAGEYEVQ